MTASPAKPWSGILQDLAALGCLVIMFLAGNDIWHDTGRPDFWHAQDPPFPDVRAFVVAYYALVLLVMARGLGCIATLLFRPARERAATQADHAPDGPQG